MNQPAQPLDLDAIQARCDAARPRPWALHDALNGDGFPGHLWVVENPADGPGDHHVMINIGARDDAEFIARARDDVPALLTRVRELEAEVERLSAVRAEVRSAIALDLMELHDDPATPERNRAGLRAAARRIPVAQDGGY